MKVTINTVEKLRTELEKRNCELVVNVKNNKFQVIGYSCESILFSLRLLETETPTQIAIYSSQQLRIKRCY